jgi:RimJ/RimL family protein N-acetyltransferase
VLIFAATPDETQAVQEWVVSRIPHMHGGTFGQCVAAGVVRDGAMAAGVIFHDWQPEYRTLQLSMAADSPRWAAADVLRGLFRYAFATAGANKLWTATPHTNTRALRFNHGIGMKQEATLRHHFGPKSHAVICSKMRAEWERSRWFQE